MFMIWKSILKKKTTWILVFGIPIVLGFFVYPAVKETAGEVMVPITIVDQTDQAITDELLNEIEEKPFQVTKMDTLDLRFLSTGEAEAIFVFNEDLEESILSGQTDDMITWYRSENSYVDGLFKEKLASAIMSRVVRAEAASIVTQYQPEADWNEVYQFGTRYFEPNPIFEMKFERISGASNDPSPADKSGDHLLFILIWLYSWLLIGYFTQFLYDWRANGIIERLQMVGRADRFYAVWAVVVLAIAYGFFWLSMQLMSGPVIEFAYLIPLTSVFLYFILFIFIKKKLSMYAWVVSYSVASFVIFLLAEWQVITGNWMYLFLPTWLLG